MSGIAATERFRCKNCGQIYRIRNARSSAAYQCKACHKTLQPFDEDDTDKTVLGALPPLPEPAEDKDALRIKVSLPAIENLPDGDLVLQSASGTVSPSDTLLQQLPPSFDGFKIIRPLAQGGMGAVLLAEQSDLRRTVALKVMLPWVAQSDPTTRDRFVREARAMAKLRHPHIIEVHQVGAVNGISYFSMEYIEGKTLSALISRREINPAQAASLIAKVARALGYAHARGVIHRDIKPANIIVRPNGHPVLMDFGLAKDCDANSMKLSMTGTVMGTPSYMSPEQAQGLGVDERSDIYSLGAVFYESLTRMAPFDGETTIATLYRVVHDRAKPASSVDPGIPELLSRICSKALEKDPAERYCSMDEMASDLDRFEAGMDIKAQAPSALTKIREWSRGHKLHAGLILGSAAAVLLAVLCLQLGIIRSGRSKARELRELLSTGSEETRLAHIQALAGDLKDGRIEKGSPERDEALQVLRLAAQDKGEDGKIAAAAVNALVDGKDGGAFEVLSAQLDPKRPKAVRKAAIAALGKLDIDGRSGVLMKIAKNDSDMELRMAALDNVQDEIGPTVLIDLLQLGVRGEPRAVALAAAKKLAKAHARDLVFGLYSNGQTQVARESSKMIEQTREYEKQLEEAAATIAGEKEPKRQPEPYEIALRKLQSDDRGERMQSAYDLGVLCDVRAEAALRKALTDEDEDVALLAAESLGKFSSIEHPAEIAALLKDASPVTRRAVARAFAVIHPTPDTGALIGALANEKSGPVQAEMANSLGRLAPPGATAALAAVLQDGAPEAQRKAAWALGQCKDKSACGALVDALENAGKDKDLSEEIVGALSNLTGKNIGADAKKWRAEIKN